MQNLEIQDVFDYTKTAKMPEGPFCQIRTHIFPETLKNSRFHQWIKVGSGYPKHRYFFIWP